MNVSNLQIGLMKTLKFLSIAVLLFAAACNPVTESSTSESGVFSKNATASCKNNTWLENTIEAAENNADQKAIIVQYHYNGQIVFLVDRCVDCADAMQVVYNCSGDELCKFGGIAGFNDCPNFFEIATDKTVIFQN